MNTKEKQITENGVLKYVASEQAPKWGKAQLLWARR